MADNDTTNTTAETSRKRGQPPLNYLLMLVLLALVAWTAKAIMNSPAPQVADASHYTNNQEEFALDARIEPLEKRLRTLEAEIEHQQKLIDSMKERPAGGSSATGQALTSGMVSALEARIAELEKKTVSVATHPGENPSGESLKALEARIWKLEAQSFDVSKSEQKKLATLRAFYLLQTAIFAGRPYTNEYAGFTDMVGENNDFSDALDILNSYAEDGIPSDQALLKEFKAATHQSLNLPLAEDAPFSDRLAHNLSSLVTIRKVGEHQKGLDKQAIIARTEAHLKKGELEAAVTEIQSMNVSDQAVFSSWLEDAKVRLDLPSTLSEIQESLLSSPKDQDGAIR